jgi:uncharacterized protein YdeI (YjbR/CyaY-like superfamily)
MASEAIFFTSQAELHAWLDTHHADTQELLIGFHKKATKRPTITYAQALDEALCYGWIDGVRRSVGDDSYTIRYTPRKPKSNWSAVNIKRANELIALGLMQPTGLREFEKRDEEKAYQYKVGELDGAYEDKFKVQPAAWEFFQAQPPSYQRAAVWWVISAKQEKTRESRLAQLIEVSADGKRLPMLVSPSKRKKDKDK